ncbi:MAG: hypothetical protein AAF591_16925 [Verrucomicrobiota bacterium]
MKNLLSHSILAGLAGPVFLALAIFILAKHKYDGIEDWPSVPAENVIEKGKLHPYRTESVLGSGQGLIDARYVEFSYSVNGVTYTGTKATPNGGGIEAAGDPPWNAYFSPVEPSIGVLNPLPYRGTRPLTVAGIFFAVSLLYIWVTPWKKRNFDRAKSVRQHPASTE